MINLYYNYYRATSSRHRDHELRTCLKLNYDNTSIDRIFLLTEEPIRDDSKITTIPYRGVPMFKHIFQIIENTSRPEDIKIIMNSDCFIDEQDMHLLSHLGDNEAWCLSRWDVKGEVAQHYQERSSQDCWIFRGNIGPDGLDFMFGVPGCDNRLAYKFYESGYRIRNPSLSFKVFHLHESMDRSTFGGEVNREAQRTHGPYIFLEASTI